MAAAVAVVIVAALGMTLLPAAGSGGAAFLGMRVLGYLAPDA
ncbi:hypothetical protein [Streptomyces sp. NPDC054975]